MSGQIHNLVYFDQIVPDSNITVDIIIPHKVLLLLHA